MGFDAGAALRIADGTGGGLSERVTRHVLRHSLATYMGEHGTDLRTMQELVGYKDVSTTQIYTYVIAKPGLGIKSPLDSL